MLLLLHSVATVQNDIEDFEVDKINDPSKPLQSGRITLKEARILQYGLVIASLIFSLLNLPIHIFFVLLMLLLAWVYNKPPFSLSRKPISSLAILGIAYGVATLLYGYTLSGKSFRWQFVLALLLWFFLRFSISIMKDYKDTKGDRMFNKNTFYLAFGGKITSRLSLGISVLSYCGILFLSLYIRTVNLFFLILIIVVIRNILIRIKLLTIHKDEEANKIFHKVFFGQNQFEALYLLWLIFSSH